MSLLGALATIVVQGSNGSEMTRNLDMPWPTWRLRHQREVELRKLSLQSQAFIRPSKWGSIHLGMKIMHNLKRVLLSVSAFTFLSSALAAIVVPGASGSDGPLDITTDTVIDLSKAGTGAWDSNVPANSGLGVYDPAKWAVVFKYSSVTIRSNATVTFRNHPSRAPVVWLVSGDVVINGKLSLDGENRVPGPKHAEPGPGGFRGGTTLFGSVQAGSGFGPGGGRAVSVGGEPAFSGTDSTFRRWDQTLGGWNPIGPTGRPGTDGYGNPSLLQLIGGSGGGGDNRDGGNGGGAGGGAIMIACASQITVDGQISAKGGDANGNQFSFGAPGSGGGVRLICDSIAGSGLVAATGGVAVGCCPGGQEGGVGRIRVEMVNNSGAIWFAPDPSTVTVTPNHEALLWPRSIDPQVRILSIGQIPVPLDPRAGFGAFGPDVALALTNRTFVSVETHNVETNSQVIVRLTPRTDDNFLEVNAGLVGSSGGVAEWLAELPVKPGYSAVQVRVVRP